MKHLFAYLLLSSGACAPTALLGQRPVESPEAIAATVLRAASARDWRTLLALAHPAALLSYRRDQVRTLGFSGFHEFSASDSCIVQMMVDENRKMLDSVYHVPTLDSLARMRPETLFARMGRYIARFPTLPDTLQTRREIVGSVTANDSTAYVIIEQHYPRRAFPDAPESRPAIMTFRALNGTWRSMLDPDLEPAPSSIFMSEGCK